MRPEVKAGIVIGLFVMVAVALFSMSRVQQIQQQTGDLPVDAGKDSLVADAGSSTGASRLRGDTGLADGPDDAGQPLASLRGRERAAPRGDTLDFSKPSAVNVPRDRRPEPPTLAPNSLAPSGESIAAQPTAPTTPPVEAPRTLTGGEIVQLPVRTPVNESAQTPISRPPVRDLPREPVETGAARPSGAALAERMETLPPAQSTHTVAQGETLSQIAEKHYGSPRYWRRIAKANPDINPDIVIPGQVLVLPPKEGPISPVTPSKTRAAAPVESTTEPRLAEKPAADKPATARATYVIGKGDSLVAIARNVLKDGDRWREIYELNKDKIRDPNNIPVGVELKLPPLEKPKRARGR